MPTVYKVQNICKNRSNQSARSVFMFRSADVVQSPVGSAEHLLLLGHDGQRALLDHPV